MDLHVEDHPGVAPAAAHDHLLAQALREEDRMVSLIHKVEEVPAYVHAMEGYAYGFPLVMMDLTKGVMTAASQSGEYSAPMNQFARVRTFVDPDFKNVVRVTPNSLMTHGFVDLEEEPFVYSHPDTKGRFTVMQATNMWTDVFASVGSRTGTKAGDFLIAGPNWSDTTPGGITQTFRCSTRYVWVVVQLAAANEQEFPEIHRLQDQLQLTPLSAWGQPYTPPGNVPVDPAVDTTATPYDQLRLMSGVDFFKRLARLLQDNPPYAADAPILKKLEKIGVEPGQDFDIDRLGLKHAEALNRAAKHVWGEVESAPPQMANVNGWLLALNLGQYGTDYNTRTVVAWFGLNALPAEDCVYPCAFVDGDAKPLDGASQYVLHFEKDGVPPTHSGIWSVSAYRENFSVRNPIERYGILSGMPLKYNTDGSLDIYIQAKSPGAAKEANWLPCPPSGPFNVTIRAYQPKQEMLDGRTEDNLVVEAGTYQSPPLRKVQQVPA